jgi:hypothetical protein
LGENDILNKRGKRTVEKRNTEKKIICLKKPTVNCMQMREQYRQKLKREREVSLSTEGKTYLWIPVCIGGHHNSKI